MQTSEAQDGAPPQLKIEGAVALLTLRRPAQANRIQPEDIAVLQQHFRSLAAAGTTVRALVITATGKHFSAGYDIGAVLDTLDAAVSAGRSNNAFGDMVDALEALPQVSFCALNGGVFGGSTDLALACDFRIGVPHTRLFMPAARLGLHYYPSGMRRYLSRLGLNAAKRLFLLADELDAAQLLRIGYLDDIVAPEELMSQVMGWADKAAATAPLASAGMKRTLNSLADGSFDAASCAARELACMRSADLREGVAAWRDRRATRFEGR